MSSHDMSLRATLKVKPEVTLPVIWSAITLFTAHFNIDLAEGESVPDFGDMPLADDYANHIVLSEDGTLNLYLSCRSGGGAEPDEIDSLIGALDRLVVAGGTLEIIDHDTSAANSEAIGARFIGADDTQRIYARLAYGLDLGRDWLVDVICPSGFDQLSQLAKSLADARLGNAPCRKEIG